MNNSNLSGWTPPAAHDTDRSTWVESKDLFRRLGELSLTCEAKNRNELATVLISGCLAEGVNTIGRIIRVLKRFGFKRQHLAVMLDRQSGPDPLRYHWYRDADAVYHSH
jgi:hypothetical protein